MKHYMGFAIRLKEDESGIFFKRKKAEEIFCKIRVGADSAAAFHDTILNMCVVSYIYVIQNY